MQDHRSDASAPKFRYLTQDRRSTA